MARYKSLLLWHSHTFNYLRNAYENVIITGANDTVIRSNVAASCKCLINKLSKYYMIAKAVQITFIALVGILNAHVNIYPVRATNG